MTEICELVLFFFLNAVDISLSILVEDLNTWDSSASQVDNSLVF